MCDSGGCHERCLVRCERVCSSYFDWSLTVGIPTARARGHHDSQIPRPNQRESVHNREAIPFHPFVSYSRSKRFQKMQGRFFASRRVEARLYTGLQRFKRSKGEDDEMLGDGADSEGKRLDDLAQWLMDEGEA